MGFSPVDGHLYASDNTNDRIIRINADYTVSNMSAVYNGAGKRTADRPNLISADVRCHWSDVFTGI